MCCEVSVSCNLYSDPVWVISSRTSDAPSRNHPVESWRQLLLEVPGHPVVTFLDQDLAEELNEAIFVGCQVSFDVQPPYWTSGRSPVRWRDLWNGDVACPPSRTTFHNTGPHILIHRALMLRIAALRCFLKQRKKFNRLVSDTCCSIQVPSSSPSTAAVINR